MYVLIKVLVLILCCLASFHVCADQPVQKETEQDYRHLKNRFETTNPTWADQHIPKEIEQEYWYWKDRFEAKILKCERKQKLIEIQEYQIDYLNDTGLSFEQIIRAVHYINERNYSGCIANEQKNFYFSAGRLLSLKKMHGEDCNEVEHLQNITIGIGLNVLKFQNIYFGFPEKSRIYLDSLFGLETFDFMKALDSITKYRDKEEK